MFHKFLSVFIVMATLSVSAPRAHAIGDVALTTLGTTAGLVISYILGFSVAATQASSGKKEAALNVVADDAASFLMNEGENPSALLVSMMDQMRSRDEVRALNEDVTDLDLARAILNQASIEMQ